MVPNLAEAPCRGLFHSIMSAKAEIIAHRGASGEAPENTLSAFQLAWEQGADAIELDVHLTRDGQLAVIHDPDTHRTTDVAGRVRNWTADELARLDAGSWLNAQFRGEPIPLLSQVLAVTPHGRRVFIEVKDGLECVEPLVKVFAESSISPAQTAMLTFDWVLAKTLQERFPDRQVGWNIERPWKEPSMERIEERARVGGLTTLSFSHDRPLTVERVAELHDMGFKVCVWTVDDVAQARSFLEAKVNGLMTNFPARIIEGCLHGPNGSHPVS